VLQTAVTPLITVTPDPVFLTLTLRAADPDPQLRLRAPWLDVPRTVFVDQPFDVTISPPWDLGSGYLQLELPKNSPLSADFSATSLQVDQNETWERSITLTAASTDKPPRWPQSASLRLVLRNEPADVPLRVVPLVKIQPLARGQRVRAETYRCGTALPPADERATAEVFVHAAHNRTDLHLAVVVDDDRRIAASAGGAEEAVGDRLYVGVVLADSSRLLELELRDTDDGARLQPAFGTPNDVAAGIEVERVTSGDDISMYQLSIPATSLGTHRLTIGGRVLLAVRYVDDDADGFAPIPLEWGGGLDGNRSTTAYQWCEFTSRR
jgi:hypothetical protein